MNFNWAGRTVPREGFDSSVNAFFLVCCGCGTSYIMSVHIQCQASIYTLSLCRGHSWRMRLAKQETLTLSGTWSHLWFAGPRGPWMSTVVLYCWCHSDSASVLLYFTFKAEGSDPPPFFSWKNVLDPRLWCVFTSKLASFLLHFIYLFYFMFIGLWNFKAEGSDPLPGKMFWSESVMRFIYDKEKSQIW